MLVTFSTDKLSFTLVNRASYSENYAIGCDG